ncbi:cobalt-precorrin-6A reductase [Clostridium estertheticum]|uniref:cobalt-precorrin-6A reductase n=1 Tax=Clostridium estertheticum TaxID=238834 RepID=UPI0013EEB89B|nr:cobalt-precorrin-6A reductase [Clostridium estertheticum]MBZ9606931.1 cobalt-precorrin-6A reductase [Clostridium estertheticum]
MIGLIVGTSEGKNILAGLNGFTEDIFISTATAYGAELLKDYKYKIFNEKPLDLSGLMKVIRLHDIKILIDASHPYALEITENAMEACKIYGVQYVRYERPSVVEKFKKNKNVIVVEDYDSLYTQLTKVEGNILNTTGSRNINKILSFNLNNRIIHRVLPSVKVLEEILELGIRVEDIVAMKGPVGYELNCGFIKEYKAKAILMKDSGVQGGTYDKIKAAIDNNIPAFIIGRKPMVYSQVFYSEIELIKYISELTM